MSIGDFIRTLLAKSIPYKVRRQIPLKVARHLYFNGVFKARLYGKEVVTLFHPGFQIENEIYWRGFDGCHEKKSMQLFAGIIQRLKPTVVWDIGANSGTYGILAKALNPNCEVVFFEPIPKATALVHKNLELNGFEAKVFEIALGDFNGTGEIFFEKGTDFATSVTVNRNTLPDGAEGDVMKIEVRRIDNLLFDLKLQTPNLVKLDVETYEYEVLCGWGELFPDKAIFLIEILRDDLAQKLVGFFPPAKYRYWNINEQNATIREVDSLGKSDFYNFLIVPNDTVNSISGCL